MRTGFRRLTVALGAVLAAGIGQAADWYVDPVGGSDDYDGTSSNVVSATVGPKLTLKGVMEATGLADNDTVWLLPGDYDKETMEGGRRRLYVTKAGLKFKSAAGAARTAIVGEWPAPGEAASGSTCSPTTGVACVKLSSAAKNCIFEGITFRDGAARSTDNNYNRGGGVHDASQSCWLFDCVISNCTARIGGGQAYGNAARCVFANCDADGGEGAAALAPGVMEFCLFNRCQNPRYSSRVFSGSSTIASRLINCTVTRSKRSVFIAEGFRAYNSVIVGNENSGSADNGGQKPEDVYATNCVFGVTDPYKISASDDCALGVDPKDVFVSLSADDYRIVSPSPAVNRGDARHLALATLPDGYEHRDLYGRPVPTSGPITAGCDSKVYPRTGSAIVFRDGDANAVRAEVQGYDHVFVNNEYFVPIADPCTYYIRQVLGDGERLFGFRSRTNSVASSEIYHYPFQYGSRKGWTAIASHFNTNSVLSVYPVLATDVLYADDANGNDAWDGRAATYDSASGSGPKQTLQAAVTNAPLTGVTLIYAAPGRYDKGEAEVWGAKTSKDPTLVLHAIRRVYLEKDGPHVGLIATEGPEKTFIVGKPDEDTGGNGPKAVGGVFLQSGKYTFVQGFTLTGCYGDKAYERYWSYGSAFGSGSVRASLLDSVVSNNVAYYGILGYGNTLRTKVVDNTVKSQYVFAKQPVYSSVIAGNVITGQDKTSTGVNGALSDGYAMFFCTIDMNGRARVNSVESAVMGSLVTNFKGTPSADWKGALHAEDPLFADAASRDFRLGALSPAIGFATDTESLYYTRRVSCTDVNGDPLMLSDGQITAGAVHNNPPLPCLVATGAKMVGGREGTNVLTAAGAVTVEATAASRRPFLGFEVNGDFRPGTETSILVEPSMEGGTVTTVRATYASDWYVDCVHGDDANNGDTLSRAKKTIRAASTNAIPGDVIHVTPGTYGEAEGSQKHVASALLESRVVLPDGVTLDALGSAEDTFIIGVASATEPDVDGNGPGAIRCAYVGAGAKIRGFTLTGGHTCRRDGVGVNDRDIYGSAIYREATADDAILEDCVVSNNFGYSATLVRMNVIRCRILGNLCQSEGNDGGAPSGSAGRYCSWHGCLIDRCIGNGALHFSSVVESCTIGARNDFYKNRTTFNQQVVYNSSGNVLLNSVLLGGRLSGLAYCTNCVLPSDAVGGNLKKENCTNCVFLSASELAKVMDDNLRPVEGSVAVDFGDTALFSEAVGETDLFGVPRVLNGRIDAGAAEFDWRPTYAKRLGSRITVTAVSPAVTNSTEGVAIPSGELAGTIGRAGSGLATFEITGNGTLSVYVNGVLVGAYVSGETSAELGDLEEGAAFRFLYAPGEGDAGAAVVKGLRARMGMLLIVR